MFGTSSVRDPSSFWRSIAMPRFTWSWRTTAGLPSTNPNDEFMFGAAGNAWSTA